MSSTDLRADPAVTRWIERIAFWATLVLPLFLLHGRALADITLSGIALLFLARSWLLRDWRWLRRTWVRVALLWWGWLVLVSIPWGAGPQAFVILRFLLLTAALEHWLLQDPRLLTWTTRLLRWSMIYLAAQCALQFVTGRNLYGWPRGADGELTGPYDKPRAGPIMARLLYPTVLPWASTPLRALLFLFGGVALMVLVGQRMPLLLSLLGLFTTALFIKKLRGAVLGTALLAGLLLAILPQVSPQAAQRVETKFARQMEDLPFSHYGLIYARTIAIWEQHPVFGAGFDAFRRLCDQPRYFHGWRGGEGGGPYVCVQHPHSFYLQALLEGGLVGLALFCAMTLSWLLAVGRGLLANPDRLRVGLFAAVLIQVWPIAGSTDWVAMPLSGWFYLELGLALALARPYMRGNAKPSEA